MKKLVAICIATILIPLITYSAGTASFLLTPKKTIFAGGEPVEVTVYAASPSQPINAVSGSINVPATLSVTSISTNGSIINFWTQQPHTIGNSIQFEGVALNPGYQGNSGMLFTVTLAAKQTGSFVLSISNAAILANDGLGTNILHTLGTATIVIKNWDTAPLAQAQGPGILAPKLAIIPVITEYAPSVAATGSLYIKGKGEPNALTKIAFQDQSLKSLGEQFIGLLQSKRKKLDDVIVQNDPTTGIFTYTSPSNLVAGAYNATPYLVDTANNTDKEGVGVHVLVTDSKLVHFLVILINVLALLIPIVGLIVLIYFIPWYSRRRMRLLKEKMHLEEEKIHLSEHKLLHQEKLIDKT